MLRQVTVPLPPDVAPNYNFPSLSSDDINSFLTWDVLNGGIAQSYLQNPSLTPEGISLDWNGRSILVWVDAIGNSHFLDTSSNPAYGSVVNAPVYTSPTLPPDTCNYQLFGVCFDQFINTLKSGVSLVAIGVLFYLFSRK